MKIIKDTIETLRNERGSAIIMLAVSIVAIFAFAVIAIDGAMLMTTRTQLHAAADAAALAGATALLEGGSQADAVSRALDFSSYNEAYQVTSQSVVIQPGDVTFPQPDIIRVQTHRTAATGDALRTFFVRVINPGSTTADMTAVSAARVFDLCSSKCLKPWAIPDRWNDANANGVFDAGEYYDPDATGYKAPTDVGATIVLKVGNPQQAIEPGIFYPVNFPPLNNPEGEAPLTGGAWYEEWIAGCSPYKVGIGDQLQLEPGNMVGPTMHGMDDLHSLDPYASWDAGSKTIIDSGFGVSPRIGLVPFFDPTQPPSSGRNYVTVTKIGAFFIESIGPGSQVVGRFIQITAQGNPCEGGGLGSGLVKGIVLVE